MHRQGRALTTMQSVYFTKTVYSVESKLHSGGIPNSHISLPSMTNTDVTSLD